MEGAKPLGGKWNFDKENQKSISKLKEAPKERNRLKSDELTVSTMVEIENCFPDSIGNLENFNWDVTHKDARKQLKILSEGIFELVELPMLVLVYRIDMVLMRPFSRWRSLLE